MKILVMSDLRLETGPLHLVKAGRRFSIFVRDRCQRAEIQVTGDSSGRDWPSELANFSAWLSTPCPSGSIVFGAQHFHKYVDAPWPSTDRRSVRWTI